ACGARGSGHWSAWARSSQRPPPSGNSRRVVASTHSVAVRAAAFLVRKVVGYVYSRNLTYHRPARFSTKPAGPDRIQWLRRSRRKVRSIGFPISESSCLGDGGGADRRQDVGDDGVLLL